MGHRKKHAPRHGSLAYLPRKRAASIKGRVRHWLDNSDNINFLGFAGFKAGMTHIAYIEDQKTSPFFGKELMKAVTIVETPPIVLFGIKIYKRDEYGLKCIGELLASEFKKELSRKIQLPKREDYDLDKYSKALKEKVDKSTEIRGLFHTQPYRASMPRIKPDIIEIKVSGGANSMEQYEFALKNISILPFTKCYSSFSRLCYSIGCCNLKHLIPKSPSKIIYLYHCLV